VFKKFLALQCTVNKFLIPQDDHNPSLQVPPSLLSGIISTESSIRIYTRRPRHTGPTPRPILPRTLAPLRNSSTSTRSSRTRCCGNFCVEDVDFIELVDVLFEVVDTELPLLETLKMAIS
jgi:hypothetical protein